MSQSGSRSSSAAPAVQSATCPPVSMRRGVKEGLQRRLAEAPPALMGAFFIITFDPRVEIALQFGNRSIDFLAEDDTVELVQHRLVESLNNAIGLRALGLGAGMIDVLERQIEFVFVMLGIAAILGAAVG